jgi:hypothetical protein
MWQSINLVLTRPYVFYMFILAPWNGHAVGKMATTRRETKTAMLYGYWIKPPASPIAQVTI